MQRGLRSRTGRRRRPRADDTPAPMARAAPDLLARLPEQYFTRILAAAAAARARPGPRFIDLGRGNPDLPPPARALSAVRDALGETSTAAVHGYPPFDGQAALREAIARRYAADHGVELDPDREVSVIPRTKPGCRLAAIPPSGRGATVALPDP